MAGPKAVDKQSARLDLGAQRQRVEMVSPPRPVVKTERESAKARAEAQIVSDRSRMLCKRSQFAHHRMRAAVPPP
jgi:hypothetical protein